MSVYVCVCVTEKRQGKARKMRGSRDSERLAETEPVCDRQTDGWTDRKTDGQKDRQTIDGIKGKEGKMSDRDAKSRQ